MSPDGVTAVVPVWNRRDLVTPIVRNLQAQTEPPEEILVVDNGSTDGAAEEAEAAGARVIRMGSNTGFARAVNRGIRESRGAWVLVVNNDVDLAHTYLALLRRSASEAMAWFATGKIFSACESNLLDGTFDVVSRGATAWRVGHGQHDGPEFSAPRAIYSAPWTAALFRTALFERVGLLEESFGSYLEDVEFGIRCAKAGCAGIFVPDAIAHHQGSATAGLWSALSVRLNSRNQVLTMARHFPSRWIWHAVVGQGLWGLLALRRGCGWAWVRGKWDGIREFRHSRTTYTPDSEQALSEWMHGNECLLRSADLRFWKVYSLLTPGEAK